MQLDLFSPERLAVGEAREALARLAFDEAIAIFGKALELSPTSSDAEAGREVARRWKALLEGARHLGPRDRLTRIWSEVLELSDDPLALPQELRAGLLEHVLSELEHHTIELIEPELCRGSVLLELGRTRDAEARLRETLESYPDRPRLLIRLGAARWRLRRPAQARAAWARALILGPEQVTPTDIEDQTLASWLETTGLATAPVRGWLEGRLPLLEIERERLPDTEQARIYGCLLDAEEARRRRHHEAMVSCRTRLRELAPEVLEAYMARLG